MKTRIILIAMLGIFLTACTSRDSSETEIKVIKKEKIQYMIVTSASYADFEDNNILKPNAALLITDTGEIGNAQEFFLTERTAYHTCGYNYDVLFWINADSLYQKTSLNKECEAFAYKPLESQKLLNHYGKLLETKPSHYIYNLEIPVSMETHEISTRLKNGNLTVFSFNDTLDRFPSILFSYRNNRFVGKNSDDKIWEKAEQENKVESEKIITGIIKKIKSVSYVINTPEINYYSYGQAGDSMTHNGTVKLYFENSNNLSDIENILQKTNAKINTVSIPDTYTIQLIDTTDNIQIIRQKLKQYKFIKNISVYLE